MAWIYLGFAGLFEIVWASFLKETAGFTRFMPSVITVIAMAASFWLLSLALRTLPLGTAYAIWTGIGAVGAFAVGVVVMGEAATLGRIASVALIVTGIIGLKLSSGH